MTKRMYSKPRGRKSASAGKFPVTDGVPVAVGTSTGYQERKTEIGQVISTAMKNLPNADWARETPETIAAGNSLDEAMDNYIKGLGDLGEVRTAYKGYARAHQ